VSWLLLLFPSAPAGLSRAIEVSQPSGPAGAYPKARPAGSSPGVRDWWAPLPSAATLAPVARRDRHSSSELRHVCPGQPARRPGPVQPRRLGAAGAQQAAPSSRVDSRRALTSTCAAVPYDALGVSVAVERFALLVARQDVDNCCGPHGGLPRSVQGRRDRAPLPREALALRDRPVWGGHREEAAKAAGDTCRSDPAARERRCATKRTHMPQFRAHPHSAGRAVTA
jgi:hypothetical protein